MAGFRRVPSSTSIRPPILWASAAEVTRCGSMILPYMEQTTLANSINFFRTCL